MRPVPTVSLIEDAREDDRVSELEHALRRTQAQLARAKTKVDDLVDATYQAARDAITAASPLRPVPVPAKDRRRAKPEVAIAHITDLQGHKRTVSYNSGVMEERVATYCRKARHITEIMRADHPVRDAVVLFGGDMIEGLFNFPTQPFEIDATLFEQWANVSRVLANTVRWALSVYEHVTVIAEWGNHGRIGSKRDAVPRSDNIDRMVYEHARMMLADEKRLTWQDCPDDIQHVEIGNYRALSVHGDEVGRNGYASVSTFIQHVNRWRSGAHPWPFQDVYVGHYHRHAQEPLADGVGAIYWTGSTESGNRYAAEQLASAGQPSQRLNFVDPEEGHVTYPIQVWL